MTTETGIKLRLFLLTNIIFSIWYIFSFLDSRGIWFYFVSLTLLLSFLLFIFSFFSIIRRITIPKIKFPKVLLWGVLLLLAIFAGTLPFTTPFQIFLHQSGRLLFALWMAGLGSLLFMFSHEQILPISPFFLLLLISATIYRIGAFIPDIQEVPFSLGWSEASRYYNASLYLSKQIYGAKAPLPVLHPSRYLLQAIPFIFGVKSIIIHRIWQVLLWIGMTLLGAYALVIRFKLSKPIVNFALILWVFLYFFQGAVYFHLMVCAILVLFGFDKSKHLRTLFFVFIASIWAGLSRLNWYPVPALLAVTLYILEKPVGKTKLMEYIKFPVIWFVFGGLTGFFTNWLYAQISGNDQSQFSSSLSSYMIWDRLFPNASYPLGILLGTLIISTPLIIAILFAFKEQGKKPVHWIRRFGLIGILSLFLLGGVVVSVKVGGGGDLHNMDAFMVFYVIMALYIIFSHFSGEIKFEQKPHTLPFTVVFLMVIVPVIFALESHQPWKFQKASDQARWTRKIQSVINLVSDEGEDVLFISERQLLTFNEIQNVKLISDYEKVMLMENVMSNNRIILDDFQNNIGNHAYSVIITDPLETHKFPDKSAFGIENNLWVEAVTIPLLENYSTVFSLNNGEVNVLIPNNRPDSVMRLKRLERRLY